MITFVELRLYNAAATEHQLLPRYYTASFDVKYDDVGALELQYPLGQAKSLGLTDGSLVGVVCGYSDGTSEEVERYYMSTTDNEAVMDGQRLRSLSGRSTLGALEDAVVYPSNWPVTTPSGHSFTDLTAGNIFRTLVLRAKNRGALANWDETTFSGTVDSSGAAWAENHTREYANGTSYLQILQEFMDLGFVDARMDGWDLVLLNGGTMGEHVLQSAVEIRPAKNVTDMTIATDSSESISTVLMEGEEGTMVERNSPEALSSLGRRRERFTTHGGVNDVGVLTILGDAELELFGKIPAEETVGVTQGSDLTPFKDFRPADWVWVRYEGSEPASERRVRQLAVSVGANRQIDVAASLNTILYENDIKLQRKIEAYAGSGGSYGSTPNSTTDTSTPNPPTGLGVFTSYFVDNSGLYQGVFNASWTAPVTNVDGSQVTDLDHYELQWKYSTDTNYGPVYPTPGDNTFLGYSPVSPGRLIDVRVRALDASGHRSAWVEKLNTEVESDTSAPPVPSVPATVSGLAAVQVSWDGLSETGAGMPVEVEGAQLWMGSTTGFTPPTQGTLITTIAPSGGTVEVSELTPGQAYYFVLIAVDRAGNTSSQSAEASAFVQTTRTDQIDYAVGTADQAIADAADAQAAVDGKVASYFDTTFPPGTSYSEGDLFYDLSDGNRMYRWDATLVDWIEVPDDATASALRDYIASRGTNLVTNGTGYLGDLTNFSTFDAFVTSDSPEGSSGSFEAPTTRWTDESITVDPAQTYKFAFYHRGFGDGRLYGALQPQDAFGFTINPRAVTFVQNTLTTLAQDLNPGDTTIELTDASGWGVNDHSGAWRAIAFHGYVDPGGKVWPAETYTRNWYTDAWPEAGITGNTITLHSAWTGPAYAAGTEASQASPAGGTYVYPVSNVTPVDEEWHQYEGTFGGVKAPYESWAQNKLPVGVATLKVGWLLSYASSIPGSYSRIAGVSIYSITEALEAQAIADGKITTYYQTAPPTADAVGDLWVDIDDDNHLYRAESAGANQIAAGEWVSIRDGIAVEALGEANTKNTIYRQETRPWPDGDPNHADDIGDVWWDTTPGPGSAWELVAKELTSNVATLTTADDHTILVGDDVAVTQVDDTFNGVYTVTAVTATTVSYSLTAADVPLTEISQEVSSLVQVLGVGEPVNVPYIWDGAVWNNARDTEVLTNTSTLSNSLTGQDEAISGAQSDITALQERTDDIELTAYAADGRINISDYEPTPEDAYRIDDDGNQVAKNEGSLWLTRTRDRQNMLLNPSFELDTSSWEATGAALARVGATEPPDGANVAEITGDGLGGEAVVSSSVYYPVDPGQNIVLSGYAQLVSGNNRATNWSADDTTGWTSNNGGLYPVTLTSSDPISGSSSAMTTRTGTLSSTVSSIYLTGGAGGTTALTVTPGEQFSMSVDVRTAHDNREANHYIQYRDSAGASLSGTGAKYAPLAQGLTTHTRLIVSDTVPAGAAYAYLVVSVSTTDGSDALDGEEVRYDNLLAGPEALPGTGYTARVGFYDDVETLISEVDGDPFTATTDAWTRLFVSVPAPDLTTQMKVSFVSPNTDDVWRLDALLAEQSAKLGRYFDGGSKGGSWVGDPHVSESLLDGGAVIRLFELSEGSWVEKFWTADTISSVAADTIIGGDTYVRPEGLQPETMDGALVADNTLAADKQYAWYVTASDTLAPGDLVNVWDNDGLYMAQRASAGTANQIYNPSFEEVLTGWFGGENTAVARVEDQDDDVSGSFVAEVTPSGGVPGGGVSGEAILSQYQIRATSVEVGDLINASGRCTRTTTAPPGSVDLVIEGTDDADVFVADVASVAVDTTNGYGYGTMDEVIIPAGVSKVRLVWRLNASTAWASGALRFDNHLMHKGRRITGYFEDPVIREAHGFVLDAVGIGDPVRVYHVGYNELIGSSLAPGNVYLATLPGEVSTSSPQDEGSLIQQVGFAPNEMVLNFTVGTTIKIV